MKRLPGSVGSVWVMALVLGLVVVVCGVQAGCPKVKEWPVCKKCGFKQPCTEPEGHSGGHTTLSPGHPCQKLKDKNEVICDCCDGYFPIKKHRCNQCGRLCPAEDHECNKSSLAATCPKCNQSIPVKKHNCPHNPKACPLEDHACTDSRGTPGNRGLAPGQATGLSTCNVKIMCCGRAFPCTQPGVHTRHQARTCHGLKSPPGTPPVTPGSK